MSGVARRYAAMLDRANVADAPLDHEVADLLRALDEALRAATAYVELYTGDGTREQPPKWAVDADGTFNAERIAAHCRGVLRDGIGGRR